MSSSSSSAPAADSSSEAVNAAHVRPSVAPSPRPPKKPLTWRSFGVSLAYVAWTFGGFMLTQAIGAVLIATATLAGAPLDQLNPSLFNTAANIIIYSLAVVIIIGVPWLVKKKKTTLQELGFTKKLRWTAPAWLLAGAFGYLILTLIVTSLAMVIFPSGNYTEAQEIGFDSLTHNWEYILAFVSLVIVAPVAEEIIFRGYLMGKLQARTRLWLAVLLSSALFAVAHMQWNVSLDTFALGIVLAMLRVVTGNIWMSIALHALKNGVAYYFLFVNPIVL